MFIEAKSCFQNTVPFSSFGRPYAAISLNFVTSSKSTQRSTRVDRSFTIQLNVYLLRCDVRCPNQRQETFYNLSMIVSFYDYRSIRLSGNVFFTAMHLRTNAKPSPRKCNKMDNITEWIVTRRNNTKRRNNTERRASVIS